MIFRVFNLLMVFDGNIPYCNWDYQFMLSLVVITNPVDIRSYDLRIIISIAHHCSKKFQLSSTKVS